MSLINCPECGKEISDKAMNCPNCGCPSAEWNTAKEGQVTSGEEMNEKSFLAHNSFNPETVAFNDSSGKERQMQSSPEVFEKQPKQKKEKDKKKDSTLSIWACVLAIFTVTFPVGFILALVDLGMNDKERKHGGSWFAIIYGVLAVIATFLLKVL